MQGKLFKALSSTHSYSFLVFLGFSLFISGTKTHIKDGNTMKTKGQLFAVLLQKATVAQQPLY